MTSVNPIAATNNPLSGRINTAKPASNPATSHQRSASFKPLLLFDPSVSSVANVFRNATVAVTHIATARNIVGTSVKTVAE